jgi:hypothetical protein
MVVEPSLSFNETRQRARYLGFPAYPMTREHDLDVWRTPARVTPATL